MEIGLLLIRAVLALILFTHAAQKLFGWFSGNGLTRQGQLFESLGLRPGGAMVAVAGISELVAATLLLLGFLTPLGALMAAGTMTVAGVTMHLNSGKFWNVAGGGEYPYVLAAFAASLAFTGAGPLSVDAVAADVFGSGYALIAEPEPRVGVLVVVLAAAVTVPFAALIRKNRTNNREELQ